MNLRTRLTIVVSVLIAIVAAGVGGIAVSSTYTAGISRIDAGLAAVAATVENASGDAVFAASSAIEDEGLAATVMLVATGGELITIKRSTVVISSLPSKELLRRARNAPVTVAGDPDYRFRAVGAGGGRIILIAVSIAGLESDRTANLNLLLMASVVLVLLSILMMRRFMRSDLRRIDELIRAAEEIAAGNTDANIADGTGRAEVDRLSRALRRMVVTLQHAIVTERDAHSAMQRFLGDASHELRTPITVVQGYLDLLTDHDRLSDEDIDRAVARSAEEVERMEALVHDLLLLAELAETRTLRRAPVDLRELIAKRIADFGIMDPNRVVSADLPAQCVVTGDARLIESLVNNIMTNIHRHTPQDAAVAIHLTQDAASTTLIVDDAGPGLPVDRYTMETQYFQRFDEARSRSAGGSGLGLSIISEVTRQHGGTMHLAPSPLGGLRTTITLPRVLAEG